MRLLLDESLPVQLRNLFVGHDASTVRYLGWNSIGNGELLALARDEFDAFMTADQKISNQQNITNRDVPIVVLKARSNRRRDLEPLIPRVLEILPGLKRGEVVSIADSKS